MFPGMQVVTQARMLLGQALHDLPADATQDQVDRAASKVADALGELARVASNGTEGIDVPTEDGRMLDSMLPIERVPLREPSPAS